MRSSSTRTDTTRAGHAQTGTTGTAQDGDSTSAPGASAEGASAEGASAQGASAPGIEIRRPFEMSPFDPLWQQLERGIQIILGISLITLFTFLGESWGAENVPYPAIFRAIASLGICFMASLLITPLALYIGMALRAWTDMNWTRIHQVRAILFNAFLVVVAVIFYLEVRDLVIEMVRARGLDPSDPSFWSFSWQRAA